MDTDKITVSVLMTAFNHEQYISKAIDSVLAQQVDFRYEIVIGDDASTDRTPDIISEYAEKYPDIIRFVKRSENIGATRNSYELNLMCRGDYIAPLEADDFWIDSRKLQKQKDFLDAHPEHFGCSTGLIYIDKDGTVIPRYKLDWYGPKKCFSIKDYDGFHLPGQTSTYMRRNIFRSPKFDYSVMYSVHPQVGDRICAAVYLLHGDICLLDEKMTAYRLPLGRKDSGTSLAYSSRYNAMNVDTALYKAQKELLLKHDMRLKGDYAARRIFYSTMVSYFRTREMIFKNTAEQFLKETKNVLRTYILFIPYFFSRITNLIANRYYQNKAIRAKGEK